MTYRVQVWAGDFWSAGQIVYNESDARLMAARLRRDGWLVRVIVRKNNP